MNRYILIIIVTAVVAAACRNTVDYDPSLSTPTLIVNSLIDASQPYNSIAVAVTGESAPKSPLNPSVHLFLNGRRVTTKRLSAPSYSVYPVYVAEMRLQAGDVVRVETSADSDDGALSAWAEDVTPETPTISSATATVADDFSQFTVNVTFTDKPEEVNFYRILVEGVAEISGISTATGTDTLITYTIPFDLDTRADPVLNNGHISKHNDDGLWLLEQSENKAAIFNDEMLDGKQTITVTNRESLHFEYDPEQTGLVKIALQFYLKVRLQTITAAEYHYIAAWNAFASDAYEPMLSGAIHFPSNVIGGTGIVGISNEDSQMVLISTVLFD